jgi:choline-sulfatase
LVIFTADHGDCTGAHGFAQKTVFYDESARVPFILSFPGKVPPETTRKLVNVGIDTLPTMMDFAGLKIPSQFKGRSLKPVCENPDLANWRDYVVVSNHMVQGAVPEGGTIVPESRGRMIRTDDYKYAVYDIGKHRESLVDMRNDPHEMHNVDRNPEQNGTLEKHRSILRKYAAETGDTEAIDILERTTGSIQYP